MTGLGGQLVRGSARDPGEEGVAPARRRPGRYLVGGLLLLAAWTALAAALLSREDLPRTGPLAFHQPELRSALAGGPSLERVLAACFPQRPAGYVYKVVGGRVGDRVLYACYEQHPDGYLSAVSVVDQESRRVRDVKTLKQGGAWPWVGMLNSGEDIGWAVFLTGVLLFLVGAIYYWDGLAPLPARPYPWLRGPLFLFYMAIPLVGWLLLLTLPWISGAQRRWLLRRVALVTLGIAAAFPLMTLGGRVDPPGVAAALLPLAALAYGAAAGRRWLAPAARPAPVPATGPGEPAPAARPAPVPGAGLREQPVPAAAARVPARAGGSAALAQLTNRELEVLRHLASGLSNAEIAKELVLSEATVKSHVARLLTKLGLTNRVQAALFVYQHGLMEEGTD